MSAAKARGTRHERTIVRALTAFWRGRFGLDPRRAVQAGRLDSGDIHGCSPFLVQAKDWQNWQAAIRDGLDGAERQRLHAGEPYGVALVKRARRPIGDAYAVMTVATWARVLLRLRRAEALLAETDPQAFEYHLAEVAGEAVDPFPRGTAPVEIDDIV